MLTTDLLGQLYPSAPSAMIQAFASQSGEILNRFGIGDRQNRLHFFLAQIGHESGGRPVEENLSYSARRMMEVWPSRFPTLASTNGLAQNPRALANRVYNDRMGNRAGSDDGWNFRGRGLIQITGRDGYASTGQAAGLDLEGRPELATDPTTALQVAAGFWTWKKLNRHCDAGDFVKVTKLINGGTVGLQDRFVWLERVQGRVPWPARGVAPPSFNEEVLSIPRLKAAQVRLKALGLYAGSIDGIFGKKSRAGLKIFQADNGLPANGKLTRETMDKLGV